MKIFWQYKSILHSQLNDLEQDYARQENVEYEQHAAFVATT